MVYANQNHSRDFSNRTILIVYASVIKIMCPGPSHDQNNLPHTVKMMTSLNATIISSQNGGHQQSKYLRSRIKGMQEKTSVMGVS